MPQDMQLVRHTLRTVGLRLRKPDVDAFSRWTEERVRKLALPGIARYGKLLGLDAALAEIRLQAGTKLDAQVVEACERVFHGQNFAFTKA